MPSKLPAVMAFASSIIKGICRCWERTRHPAETRLVRRGPVLRSLRTRADSFGNATERWTELPPRRARHSLLRRGANNPRIDSALLEDGIRETARKDLPILPLVSPAHAIRGY